MPDIITIPSTTRYLGAVRRFVEAHAQELGDQFLGIKRAIFVEIQFDKYSDRAIDLFR